MKQEIKASWLEALRSGRFEQTDGALSKVRDGRLKHCCLGVLCELAVEAGVVDRDAQARDVVEGGYVGYVPKGYGAHYGETSVLPAAVTGWAELDETNPGVSGPDGRTSLAGLNDDHSYTFAAIADVIEREL